MEYKVVEDKKDIIKISFKDIDQGFMTLVKDKIWEDKATELAAFKVTHPEVGELVFLSAIWFDFDLSCRIRIPVCSLEVVADNLVIKYRGHEVDTVDL